MSVLTTIQSVCRRTGIPSPLTVFGNPDRQVAQMLELLDELTEMISLLDLQCLRKTCTFIGQSTPLQGELQTLAPLLRRIIPETFVDVTGENRVLPASNDDIVSQKLNRTSSPYSRFYIQDNGLYLTDPQVGNTYSFDYFDKKLVRSATDSSSRTITATQDSDEFMISESVIRIGLRWKWKAEKGLDYSEELADFNIKLAVELAEAQQEVTINVGCQRESHAGLIIPPGSWNVSLS